MRILPRVNDAINEEWISDKARHVWDGLRTSVSTALMSDGTASLSRRPGTRRSRVIAEQLKGLDGERFAAIAGDLAAAEEMFALKLLAEQLGSPNIDCRQDGAQLDPRSAAPAICSTPPSQASTRPTRSCSSAPIRATKRRC